MNKDEKILLKDYKLLSELENKELLEIRNQENIIKFSKTKNLINFNDHINWIKTLNQNQKYFAIFYKDEIIGGINIFDLDTKPAWGVFFADDINPIKKSIVSIYFINYVFHTLKLSNLYAQVLQINQNALSFNVNLGFKKSEINNDIINLVLDSKEFEHKQTRPLLRGVVKKMKTYTFELVD